MTQALLDIFQAGLNRDLLAFCPELVLCTAIVLMLFVRLFPFFDRKHLGWVAFFLTLYAIWVSANQWIGRYYDPRIGLSGDPASLEIFSGLLVYDNFTIFLRLFLFSFTALVILLGLITGIPDKEDSADFSTLILGATIGMSIMASANHLLTIFVGIEMASLPSYALSGFLKGRRQSSEAALKYVVYGGGAAGVMLYGMSLLAGKFGTGYLPDLLHFMSMTPVTGLTLLGTLFVLIGIAFKLAAVPFHFWCPDVFEGASAEVAAFLSVASKGAALALLARITLGLAGLTGRSISYDAWSQVATYLAPTLAFFAALTTTFGNLAAYGQTNLKRLLAYSTIAHAGFMMMGLATLTREGAAAVLTYLVIYFVMNLGAFAVVAFLRNMTGSEELNRFRGLMHRAPDLVIALGVFMLSLLGIPPLAGFFAKFEIFQSLYHAAQQYSGRGLTGLAGTMYALIVIGALNSVLSLFYYLKVMKVMVLDKSVEEVEGQVIEPMLVPEVPKLYVTLLAVASVVFIFFWNTVSNDGSLKGIASFRDPPAMPKVAQLDAGQGVQP